MTGAPTHHDAAAIGSALDWRAAVDALRAALADGLDPEAEPPRAAYPFGGGQILVMPAGGARYAGVKLATVAPDTPGRTLPRIQALYVLFDADTLAPVATLDGTALTSLRTPAVSALGVDLLAPADAHRLVVFGSGPQAHGHVQALRAVRPVDSVRVVGRDPGRTGVFVDRLRAEGVAAQAADATAVATADLVACCTTARTPVFDGRLLSDGAVVVACGSHEPDAREVDAETVRRCGVAVEAAAVALAEAGDVLLAVEEAAIAPEDLVTLARLVRGAPDTSDAPDAPDEPAARPRLIKTVGMGWEDLVLATAVVEAGAGRG